VLKEIVLAGLAIAVTRTPTQSPTVEQPEQSLTISVTSELVLLDVGVKDIAGERISNLTKSNFRVYEDGKLQTITEFASDDVPVTIGLVIDTSASMRPKYPEVVAAALAFIEASNSGDEVFVVNFGDHVGFGLPSGIPFSANLVELKTALSFKIPDGRTALYDAIMTSLRHLEKGTCQKKTLMVVSDGGDNSSIHGPGEVMRMVRESRATIFTIGIFDADDPDRNPALLRGLTRVSGGESYFPMELSEIGPICQQIAKDIRTRYTIGYVPARTGKQGTLRHIRVTASNAKLHRLVVHTRTGYMVPPTPTSIGDVGESSGKRGK
jgi:VWFA-related protein